MGFPNHTRVVDPNFEVFLIGKPLLFALFVFGISVNSVFFLVMLVLVFVTIIVDDRYCCLIFCYCFSIACSSCWMFILSTCSFRFFSPGVLSVVAFFLSRPICRGGVKSKLVSIGSVDASLTGVLSLYSSVSVWVSSSS